MRATNPKTNHKKRKPPGADTLDGSQLNFARQQNNQNPKSAKAASACLETYQTHTRITSSTSTDQESYIAPTDKVTDRRVRSISRSSTQSEVGEKEAQMVDTLETSNKPVFRSKLRRQRQRRRMHKRTVFDAARYDELQAKCLALAKTAKAAPAPKYNRLPSLSRLNELLVTNFETGAVRAKVCRPRLKPGDLLGSNATGYLQIYIDGKPYKLHRVIWKMKYGCDPVGQIDHKDGNKKNNRIANLRDVSPLENNRNRCLKSSCSSGRTGVSRCSTTGLWVAHASINNRVVHLGKYTVLQDAIAARQCGEQFLYGITLEKQEAA